MCANIESCCSLSTSLSHSSAWHHIMPNAMPEKVAWWQTVYFRQNVITCLKRRSNIFGWISPKGSAKDITWNLTDRIHYITTIPCIHLYSLFLRFTHSIKSASIFHAIEIEFCSNRVDSCQISLDVLFQIEEMRVNLH